MRFELLLQRFLLGLRLLYQVSVQQLMKWNSLILLFDSMSKTVIIIIDINLLHRDKD